MEDTFVRALAFATEKHKGQKRKGGEEYITHPIAVSELVKEWGYGTDYQLAALFHDLLEDTDATEAEIEALAGSEVLRVVKLLTKEKDYNMADYIAGIKSNPMAFVVKKADRLHNVRSAVDTDESFKRKYIKDTQEWYLDFGDEIKEAVDELENTLF